VYCPRCGTPNESGDRFCSACGTELREAAQAEQRSIRERISALIGTTRKARIITTATAVAVVIAVAGFIALKPAKDTFPRDAYTIEAEEICLSAKRQIVAVERAGGADFAGALVPIVVSWRSQMQSLTAPEDRVSQAEQLQDALLAAELRVARLARVPPSDSHRVLVSARRADAASAEVEEAVSSLGLSECAEATIGLAPQSG
jgi:hypothetical protein